MWKEVNCCETWVGRKKIFVAFEIGNVHKKGNTMVLKDPDRLNINSLVTKARR